MGNEEVILSYIIIVLLIFIIIDGKFRMFAKRGELKNNNDKLLEALSNLQKEIRAIDKHNVMVKNQVDGNLSENREFLNKEQEKEIHRSNFYIDNVKRADILKDYAKKILDFIDFCEIILKMIEKKIKNSNREIVTIMTPLLNNALLNTTEMNKWKQICGDICDTGIVILNKDMKNCFQTENETEQLKAFKNLMLSKAKIFTNAILILCEANSNLSKFVKKDISSFEQDFKDKNEEIREKAIEIGITQISEVKIFKNIDIYNDVISDNAQVSFPYSIVKNLSKDDIIEIMEFGMKTEFENMTKTKVITK